MKVTGKLDFLDFPGSFMSESSVRQVTGKLNFLDIPGFSLPKIPFVKVTGKLRRLFSEILLIVVSHTEITDKKLMPILEYTSYT